MNRKEFLKITGLTLTTYFFVQSFGGCSSSSTSAPANVDFTIDLNNPEYEALKNNGGYVVVNNVLIFKDIAGVIRAASSKCTHEGTTLEYDSTSNLIVCPKHGAEYSLDGKVTKGPAKKNIVVYKVEVNGNVVHIFS
jgi:cytochrome b6-f complex iron-sulfur subunit